MGILDDIQQLQMQRVQQAAQQQGFAQPDQSGGAVQPAPEPPQQSQSQVGNSFPAAQAPQPQQPDPMGDSGQAGRLQAGMADYANMLLKQAAQLSQPKPQSAWQRARQGFSDAGMHYVGLPTQREQNLQNMGVQYQALKTAVDVNESGIKQQQLGLQSQSVTIMTPNGPMQIPMALAKTLAPAYARGAATTGAAQIKANSAERIAGLKMMAESGKVAKWMPVQGENGVVMQGFGKDGQPVSGATVDNAVFPWLMQNTSSTMEYKETADGIVALPKTTVTSKQPVVAGGARAAGGGTIAPSGGGLTAKPVTGVGGEPLMPKLTSSSRTMIEAAPKVVSFVDRINSLIDQQEKDLGPAKSRWSEFMAGKVGAPNPEFTKLRTNVGLLQTLLMRMHVGARGGEYIMKHFTDLMDSSKQSPENMRAAMGEIKQYANDLIAENQPPTPKGTGNSGVLTLTDGGKSYKIPAALKANFLKDHPNAR